MRGTVFCFSLSEAMEDVLVGNLYEELVEEDLDLFIGGLWGGFVSV